MKALLDTSVLVATFYGDHEHHQPSIDAFVKHEKQSVCCAAHSLAEVYASLTAMPGRHRASPDEALLFLTSIRERLTLVALNEREYFRAIESASGEGLAGGSIYDALLAACAVKAGAETIYTWNVKHFRKLGPEIARRVTTP